MCTGAPVSTLLEILELALARFIVAAAGDKLGLKCGRALL